MGFIRGDWWGLLGRVSKMGLKRGYIWGLLRRVSKMGHTRRDWIWGWEDNVKQLYLTNLINTSSFNVYSQITEIFTINFPSNIHAHNDIIVRLIKPHQGHYKLNIDGAFKILNAMWGCPIRDDKGQAIVGLVRPSNINTTIFIELEDLKYFLE